MTTEIRDLSATAADRGRTILETEARSEADPASFNSAEFWRTADLFVYAAALVASFFLPSPSRKRGLKESFPDRGAALCALYEIDECHFAGVRVVRHSFAHIDERYEEFWLDDPNRNIGSHLYVAESSMQHAGPLARFHGFDPETQILTFGGDAIDVESVTETMASIYQKSDGVNRALARAVASERG